MALLQDVTTAMTDAMRRQDAPRLSALRMLKAALMNKGVEKNRALEAPEELQVVSSLVKQRRDSIEQFTAGGRTDLAQKEEAEIAILETYLPPSVSARVAVEQASTFGWAHYVGSQGATIGMTSFGASAPLKVLQREFGFGLDHIVAVAKDQIKKAR